MKRSEVWEETLLLPVRVKLQREADGTVVMQLPGYQLREMTVYGQDKTEAEAKMGQLMQAIMGVPTAQPRTGAARDEVSEGSGRLTGCAVLVTNGFPLSTDARLRELRGVCVWDAGTDNVVVEFDIDVPHGDFPAGGSKQAWVPRGTVTPIPGAAE